MEHSRGSNLQKARSAGSRCRVTAMAQGAAVSGAVADQSVVHMDGLVRVEKGIRGLVVSPRPGGNFRRPAPFVPTASDRQGVDPLS